MQAYLAGALLILGMLPLQKSTTPVPAAPPLTEAERARANDSLARKLREIEAQQKSGHKGKRPSVLVTETELNNYLNLPSKQNVPRSVSEVRIGIQEERIHARGMVDLEDVKGRIKNMSPWNPLAFMTGLVPVDVIGRLDTKDGFGTLQVEQVYVASVPIPLTMLQQMVQSGTVSSRYPEGFDINAPFRLPYEVKRVRLQSHQAYLDF